jgi:hypothetical protein
MKSAGVSSSFLSCLRSAITRIATHCVSGRSSRRGRGSVRCRTRYPT